MRFLLLLSSGIRRTFAGARIDKQVLRFYYCSSSVKKKQDEANAKLYLACAAAWQSHT